MDFHTPITELKGVGDKSRQLLEKLGVYTIGDILLHFPRDYVTYPTSETLSNCKLNVPAALLLTIQSAAVVRRTRSMTITVYKTTLDGKSFEAIWFGMPYISNSLKKGKTVVLYGTITQKNNSFHMEQPTIFSAADYEAIEGKIQPVYGLTKGVTNNFLRKLTRQALDSCDDYMEYLPTDIRRKYELAELNFSMNQIHFPNSRDDLIQARKRLVFDEFFLFLMTMQIQKQNEEKLSNPYSFGSFAYLQDYIEKLSYELTGAQKRTLQEVLSDLTGQYVMQRLIQGDVGSGKTIVAFLSMLFVSDQGYQSAIMAPTEVLARQHAESFCELLNTFGLEREVVLLTGSMTAKEKRLAREKIASHKDALIIGTHALIQEKVDYTNLALVITDEQHRFGVRQREAFAAKGQTVHILVMSATPIPRTLAIILYGDMDISVMDELPAKRLPIKNCVVGENYRQKATDFIRQQVSEGHQAYIICPLVEASENYDAFNVNDYTKQLSEKLPDVRIGCLHGKMKPAEKNQVMEAFKNHEMDVLVSTTVVEVGVNVPNATLMLIENADRFGLAQLHQLRGRVGRGDAQSYCIMMNSSESELSKKRLDILNKSNDGFFIASEDLKLRGPGDFFGIRQSGDMTFALADIYTDANVLSDASKEVKKILEEDSKLLLPVHENLKIKMEQVFAEENSLLFL